MKTSSPWWSKPVQIASVVAIIMVAVTALSAIDMAILFIAVSALYSARLSGRK